MKRIYFAGLLLLGACGSNTAVLTAENALTAAERVALAYVTQPGCPVGTVALTCSDAALTAKIKAADNVAYAAVKGLASGSVSAADATAAINALTLLVPTK